MENSSRVLKIDLSNSLSSFDPACINSFFLSAEENIKTPLGHKRC
jgi:hypothetical protein